MTTIQLRLPDEILAALKQSPHQFEIELRLAAAIHWYQQGTLSQERAARFAGLDLAECLAELARRGVDSFHVDLDDLRREIADAS